MTNEHHRPSLNLASPSVNHFISHIFGQNTLFFFLSSVIATSRSVPCCGRALSDRFAGYPYMMTLAFGTSFGNTSSGQKKFCVAHVRRTLSPKSCTNIRLSNRTTVTKFSMGFRSKRLWDVGRYALEFRGIARIPHHRKAFILDCHWEHWKQYFWFLRSFSKRPV